MPAVLGRVVCATECECQGTPERRGWGTHGRVHPVGQASALLLPAASSQARPGPRSGHLPLWLLRPPPRPGPTLDYTPLWLLRPSSGQAHTLAASLSDGSSSASQAWPPVTDGLSARGGGDPVLLGSFPLRLPDASLGPQPGWCRVPPGWAGGAGG